MDQQLNLIQKTELEILDAVDRFCSANDIRYSMSYGTLLGAVRHHGFIPWDDDIDLMMMRDQYDKFIRLWKEKPPRGYFLQTDETDPPYGNNFLKIRKEGTTFIQSEKEKTVTYHTGIFIDIFPVDRVAPAGRKRKMQFAACQINMLMTRNHPSGRKGFSRMGERILLSCPSALKSFIKKKSYRYKTKWNTPSNSHLPLFWNGTVSGARRYFCSDLFDSLVKLPFEGKSYPAFGKYDDFLTYYFGDYMKLPPEDKRITHHPVVVDFEYEYTELKRRQQNA